MSLYLATCDSKHMYVVKVSKTVYNALFFGQFHVYDFVNLNDELYIYKNLYIQNGLTWEGISIF